MQLSFNNIKSGQLIRSKYIILSGSRRSSSLKTKECLLYTRGNSANGEIEMIARGNMNGLVKRN